MNFHLIRPPRGCHGLGARHWFAQLVYYYGFEGDIPSLPNYFNVAMWHPLIFATPLPLYFKTPFHCSRKRNITSFPHYHKSLRIIKATFTHKKNIISSASGLHRIPMVGTIYNYHIKTKCYLETIGTNLKKQNKQGYVQHLHRLLTNCSILRNGTYSKVWSNKQSNHEEIQILR